MTFFSVVVPAYNAQQYIGQCLDSLEVQSFRDFEVIVVNDGSTDATGEICRNRAESAGFPLKVVEQSNGGLLAARVEGTLLAEGEYVVNLDSDDYLTSSALAELQDAVKQSSSDVIFFDLALDDQNPVSPLPYEKDSFVEKSEVLSLFCSSWLLNSACRRVTRRSCALAAIRYVPKGMRVNMAEDRLQTAGVLQEAESFYYCSATPYIYRNQENASTLSRSRYSLDLFYDEEAVQIQVCAFAQLWEQGSCGTGLVDACATYFLSASCAHFTRAVNTLGYSSAKLCQQVINQSALFQEAFRNPASMGRLRRGYQVLSRFIANGPYAAACATALAASLRKSFSL